MVLLTLLLGAEAACSRDRAPGAPARSGPPYEVFNQFCTANFGAQTEPLIREVYGSAPQFVASGFWKYESRNSASIGFETTLPTLSRVEYGTTTAYGQTTSLPDRPYYIHLHQITGLLPGTLYHYRLVATDELGQQIVSADQTFTTPALASAIAVPGSLAGPPYVLNQSNATYILTQDITSNTRGITVSGSNVTLDLNGHTVVYDNGTPAVTGDWSVYLNNSASSCGVWSSASSGTTRILNGVILQGAHNGTGDIGIGFNPVLISSGNHEVAGVVMKYAGDSVSGLEGHWATLEAHHNVVVDQGTVIADRHQGLKAILAERMGANGIHHNLIKRARHQGIMYAISGTVVESNEIYLDSYDTNAYGIWPTPLVRNNRIFGTGYHVVGIGWGSQKTIQNNLIFLQGVAPTDRSDESGTHSSVNGLRLTQYDGSTVPYEDNLYEGNTIIVKAREGCTIARGVQFFSDPYVRNLRFRNNIVKAETQDSQTSDAACVVAHGLSDRAASQLPVIYENNTFIANATHVRFGDDYAMGGNHIFRNNIFRRFGSRSDFKTIRMGFWLWNSYNNRFIDSAVEGGAGVDNWEFLGTGRRDYAVGHSLYLIAQGSGGVPLDLDSLLVSDNTGINYRVQTDATGLARVELIEYAWVANTNAASPTRVNHSGHTLSIPGYLPLVVSPTLFQVANNSSAPTTVTFAADDRPGGGPPATRKAP